MTKEELIKELQKYPDGTMVFIAERKTEFTFGLVNSVVYQSDVNYIEENLEGGNMVTKINAIILDEE